MDADRAAVPCNKCRMTLPEALQGINQCIQVGTGGVEQITYSQPIFLLVLCLLGSSRSEWRQQDQLTTAMP